MRSTAPPPSARPDRVMPAREWRRRRSDGGGRSSAGALIAVLLVAMNLRPAFTTVGPVLPDIRTELGLSSAAAALLTGLPVLCLGVLAPIAPFLTRRLGVERAIAGALVALAVGLAIRPAGAFGWLILATVPVGGAVAVGNVLLPVIVKRDFAARAGWVTGLYTAAMSLVAALAAAASVPLASLAGIGWRGALAVWALPVALAIAAWLPRAHRPARNLRLGSAGDARRYLRDPLAWQVTAFLGLQSLGFYASIAWLPTIYRDLGMPGSEAGLLASVVPLAGIVGGLTVPAWAARARDQRFAAAAVALSTAIGLLGVALAPMALPLLWVLVIGISQGAGFPLGLTLIVLRTRTPPETQGLSAMVHTIGYAIAAGGPLLVGAVHDLSGGWLAPTLLLVALTVGMAVAGLGAGRHAYVGGTPTQTATHAATPRARG